MSAGDREIRIGNSSHDDVFIGPYDLGRFVLTGDSVNSAVVRQLIREETEEDGTIDAAIDIVVERDVIKGANAAGTGSTAFGENSRAGGRYSAAFGREAAASGSASTAIGRDAQAHGHFSTALGHSAYATRENALALGSSAHARARNAIAIGTGASATGAGAIAIGRSVSAAGGQIHIGDGGHRDVRIGAYNLSDFALKSDSGENASGDSGEDNSLPVRGAGAGLKTASASVPVAPAAAYPDRGADAAMATGTDATAFGRSADASGDFSTAIGQGARATGANAVAIGRGVSAGEGEIRIGSESQGNVRVGSYDLGRMRSDIGRTNDKLNKAIAMSMARQLIGVEQGKRARVGLSTAGYSGEYGIAGSFGVRVNEDIQVHFSGSTSHDFDEKAFQTGIDFQF